MWQGGRVQRARADVRPLEQRWTSGGLPTVGQAGGGMSQPTKSSDAMLLLDGTYRKDTTRSVTRNARELN